MVKYRQQTYLTMLRQFITLFCVAAASFALPAKGQGGSVMTLRDCMQYAVSGSTKMRIRNAETGDARIARRDAILTLFTPRISASSSAGYSFGRGLDPQTNTYATLTSFSNSYGINASYTLFDGFTAVNNLKIAKTSLLISESQEKQEEANICLAVMEAYYNVVYYKRLADVYEEQAATAEQALRKAQRQEELGQIGHADVVQLEADLADRRYDLINTRNRYEDQRMTLSDLLFWSLDEELIIDTELPAWQAESLNADAVVAFALGHHPELLIAGWNVDNARRQLSIAKWQLLPTLSASAGWSTSYYSRQGSIADPFRSQLKNNSGEYVSFSLSIPVYERLSRHSDISRRRNALTRVKAELDQKRRDIESEVRRAMQDRNGASSAYLQAQHKAGVQEEAYTLNLRKLEQGLISPLEFQTANDNYLRAKADEMNSLFQYLIKQAVVRYYNGESYLDQ